jgi:hypothetical protein
LPQRPSANNGVDRAQTLVEIACGVLAARAGRAQGFRL